MGPSDSAQERAIRYSDISQLSPPCLEAPWCVGACVVSAWPEGHTCNMTLSPLVRSDSTILPNSPSSARNSGPQPRASLFWRAVCFPGWVQHPRRAEWAYMMQRLQDWVTRWYQGPSFLGSEWWVRRSALRSGGIHVCICPCKCNSAHALFSSVGSCVYTGTEIHSFSGLGRLTSLFLLFSSASFFLYSH